MVYAETLKKTSERTPLSGQVTTYLASQDKFEMSELDLSQPAERVLFLDNAEAVYQETLSFAERAKVDHYESLTLDDILGVEIFTIVQQKFTALKVAVAECEYNQDASKNNQPTDEQIDDIQKLYDDLIFLAQYVVEAYGVEEDTLEKSVGRSEDSPEKLFVCGINLPITGKLEMKTAGDLREALLVASEQEPFFLQDYNKQITANKLIRQLANIPKEGFQDTELQQIIGLAQLISSPAVPVLDDVVEPETIDWDSVQTRVGSKILAINLETEPTEIIPIKVTDKVRDKYQINPAVRSDEKGSVEFVSDTRAVPLSEGSDTGAKKVPKKRQINHPSLANSTVHATKSRGKTPLADKYLRADFYADFVATYYDSRGEFERVLNSAIMRIEAHTLDVFERWLGERFYSPFAFIKDLTVDEVQILATENDVRSVLADKDIKYETFLTWVDLIADMETMVEANQQLLFGELFLRWVIESEIEYIKQEEQS